MTPDMFDELLAKLLQNKKISTLMCTPVSAQERFCVTLP